MINKIIILFGFIIIFLVGCTDINENIPQPPIDTNEESFCGVSLNSSCNSDSECYIEGCSGSLCGGEEIKGIATTCEYRECYDNKKYNLNCGCNQGICSWN